MKIQNSLRIAMSRPFYVGSGPLGLMSGTASFDKKFISHEINRHLRSENNLDTARKISLVLEVYSTHYDIEKSARIQFSHSSAAIYVPIIKDFSRRILLSWNQAF